MERGPEDAHLDAALYRALLAEEELEASEFNTLLQAGGSGEAEETGAAAAAADAARPLAATTFAEEDVAQRVVARWRALVAERKPCPLLDLFQAVPDLVVEEVLKRLDRVDLTMLAQVGRPWLAAVLASGLPRLPKGVRVRLRLVEFCTSAERLAWARANGCPWGASKFWNGSDNPCALAALGGHLEALRWAREHDCPWGSLTCERAAWRGQLAALQWARAHGCEWDKDWCDDVSRAHPDTLAWVRQQPT